MKRILFFILSLLVITNVHASLYDGCKGYYSFNNTWIDASPSDQTAESSGNLSFVEGQKGQGVYLDGIDDYISLGGSNYVDRLTISFWIKLPEQPDFWQPVISKFDETDDSQLKHTFYLKVLGAANGNRLYFAVSEDGQQSGDIISDTMIENNQWYHVVAMFQTGLLTLYLDGEKVKEKQTPIQKLFTSAVPVMIGSMLTNGEVSSPYAHVILDELRLYNRCLSKTEIQDLFENQSGPEILYHTPKGIVNKAVSYVDIHFNVPIIPTLLTSDDFLLLDPDQYTIPVNMPEKLSETTYRFSFEPQEKNGSYFLQLGPDIYDAAGNLLNQNQDQMNGAVEDVYIGAFKVNAQPDNVLLVNMSGSTINADNIRDILQQVDAEITHINLNNADQENLVIKRLTQSSTEYQQVWVYDTSNQDGKYLNAIEAISTWFLAKQGRQIICDARIRASLWYGNLETIGKELIQNYYDNLKLNAGGLVLATDQPEDLPDINAICKKIDISDFGAMTTYDSVEIDPACSLMSYPNPLNAYLDSTDQASMVPTGQQSNGLHLYCVAWDPDDCGNCNISTTIPPLMPSNLKAQVDSNSIHLSWSPAQPETDISCYNIYLSQEQFTSISGQEPYQSVTDDTHLTISSLTSGKTYYIAATAVDQNDNERRYVMPISATTDSPIQGDSSGCFLKMLW
jgi:hypothetical protein